MAFAFADNRTIRLLPEGTKPVIGSIYEVRYDATRQEWSGTLTVSPDTFEGAGSGLFALLSQLDAQYRATLGPAGPEE